MPKVVQLSNDVDSAFYLDGKRVCTCEPYELDVILRALGFDYEDRLVEGEDEFPKKLEE